MDTIIFKENPKHTNYSLKSPSISKTVKKNYKLFRILNTEKVLTKDGNLIEDSDRLLRTCKDSISSFELLEKGWDSYESEPISEGSVNLSIVILNYLYLNGHIVQRVFPIRDGGIQLEFTSFGIGIEIEIHEDFPIVLSMFDGSQNVILQRTYEKDNLPMLVNDLEEVIEGSGN